MVRQREIPKLSPHMLADSLVGWLRSGDYDSVKKIYTPSFLGGRRLEPSGDNYVQREHKGARVYMRMTVPSSGRVEQIYWFDHAGSTSLDPKDRLRGYTLNILNVQPNGSVADFTKALALQLEKYSPEQLNKCGKVFGESKFVFSELEFYFSPQWKEKYQGVLISTGINKIPLGRRGSVSANLFEYGFFDLIDSAIARPGRQASV